MIHHVDRASLLLVLLLLYEYFLDELDDYDIVITFKEYKSKAEHVESMHVNDSTLRKAIGDANTLLTIFEGHRKQHQDDAIFRTQQSYSDSIKSLKKFIKKYGKKLNRMFKDKNIPEVIYTIYIWLVLLVTSVDIDKGSIL